MRFIPDSQLSMVVPYLALPTHTHTENYKSHTSTVTYHTKSTQTHKIANHTQPRWHIIHKEYTNAERELQITHKHGDISHTKSTHILTHPSWPILYSKHDTYTFMIISYAYTYFLLYILLYQYVWLDKCVTCMHISDTCCRNVACTYTHTHLHIFRNFLATIAL